MLVFYYFFFHTSYCHGWISFNLKFVNNTGRKYLMKKKEDFIGMGQQHPSYWQSIF